MVEPATPEPVLAVDAEVEARAWAEMIYQSVRFANWAAGQGICPVEGEPAEAPDEFLMAFSDATGFEDWEGLDVGARDRLTASQAEAAALRVERDEAKDKARKWGKAWSHMADRAGEAEPRALAAETEAAALKQHVVALEGAGQALFEAVGVYQKPPHIFSDQLISAGENWCAIRARNLGSKPDGK